MTDAGFYEGLNFHWKRETMIDVSLKESQVLLPVAYLGEAVSVVKEITTGNKADTLVALAIGKTDREFKTALMADPELKGDTALLNEVFNKGLMDKLIGEGKLAKGGDGKYTFKV